MNCEPLALRVRFARESQSASPAKLYRRALFISLRNQPTNFLLITSDQQHWSALGAVNDKIKTPNLDRLCAQGTRVHLRALVTPRYKPTIYRDQTYGELFDLLDDPDERRNLWDDASTAGIKAALFQKLAYAEIRREPTALSRIAQV